MRACMCVCMCVCMCLWTAAVGKLNPDDEGADFYSAFKIPADSVYKKERKIEAAGNYIIKFAH